MPYEPERNDLGRNPSPQPQGHTRTIYIYCNVWVSLSHTPTARVWPRSKISHTLQPGNKIRKASLQSESAGITIKWCMDGKENAREGWAELLETELPFCVQA